VLKEVGDIELDGDGEEEIELDEEDLEYEEEEEDERYIVNGDDSAYRCSISPEVEEPHSDSNSTSDSPSSVKGHLKYMKTARKRPSDELDGEDADESGLSNDDSSDSSQIQGSTTGQISFQTHSSMEVVCRKWKAGTCHRGNKCRYQHGDGVSFYPPRHLYISTR